MIASTRMPKPEPLPLIRENLPLPDLEFLRQFVAWDLELRPSGWTKVPKHPRTGRNAKSNDEATWGTIADLERHERWGLMMRREARITFIDIDNGIDAAGQIKPWALEKVDRFPHAYWELSTLGTGLKGLVRGLVPRNRVVKYDDGQIELWSSGKFTALTGHRLPGSANRIGDGQAALDALFAELTPEPEAPIYLPSHSLATMDDEEIIRRCRSARNAAKFAALFDRGETDAYGGDASDADLALIALLKFWTQDPEQLDRLFRRSALMRDKWGQRPDYRRRTIAKARDGGRVYLPPATVVLGGMRVRGAQLRGRMVRHA